jgi:hypothetical protein
MPYWVVLKDERRTLKDEHPTSNIQRPTRHRRASTCPPPVDRMKNKYSMPKLFSFLFSRFDTRNENLN